MRISTVLDYNLYPGVALTVLTVFATYVVPDLLLQVLALTLVGITVSYAVSMHKLVHTDALTGLLNRRKFNSSLESRAKNSEIGVLLMDLNRFKIVNDTLGHQVGDELLRLVATRFRSLLRDTDLVARVGGDEFAVILDPRRFKEQRPSSKVEDVTSRVCSRILESLEEPFVLEGYPIYAGVSIGAVVSTLHGNDPVELMRKADVAMYSAKREGSGFALYDVKVHDKSVNALVLASDVRYAIENDQFVLRYQPQKRFYAEGPSTMEALVRWVHPTKGVLYPDEFIPACEQMGILPMLSRWVVRESIRQNKEWRDRGLDVCVSVNISGSDLEDLTFIEYIKQTLDELDLPHCRIMLEVTETTVIQGMAHGHLSDIGLKVSIDDYGTGHTSLDYLRKLPVQQVKIDKSFVQNVMIRSEDLHIVQSTILLAHELGYEVVAEGVETREVHDLLQCLECDVIQGYYISKPLPPFLINSALLDRIRFLS